MKFGKRHYRPQVDQMDCGVASLAMVFGYYGSYYSLAHLRELAKTTMDGTTALGLVKVAEEIGFETRAIKADMTLFDLPDLTFPFVAHVLKEGKGQIWQIKECHIRLDTPRLKANFFCHLDKTQSSCPIHSRLG